MLISTIDFYSMLYRHLDMLPSILQDNKCIKVGGNLFHPISVCSAQIHLCISPFQMGTEQDLSSCGKVGYGSTC